MHLSRQLDLGVISSDKSTADSRYVSRLGGPVKLDRVSRSFLASSDLSLRLDDTKGKIYRREDTRLVSIQYRGSGSCTRSAVLVRYRKSGS